MIRTGIRYDLSPSAVLHKYAHVYTLATDIAGGAPKISASDKETER